ncbi:MAG: class I SAM-dependent methyltransferase [Planctomycetota bacterium]
MQRNELLETNRQAWNGLVAKGNRWTRPVDSAAIEQARSGKVEIVLTPQKIVPQEWFPDLPGCKTLLLAGSGGQQAPLLAAAGADVTVVDLSDSQLAQDRMVAEREGLAIELIQASMDAMDMLQDDRFDLIIHPCSNCFVPDLEPVWREAARVTRSGGILLAGCCNPLLFLFDEESAEKEGLKVAYALPYSDEQSLSAERFKKLKDEGEPLMFGHTLSDQLGGQMRAGFQMTDLFEDRWGDAGDQENVLLQVDQFCDTFLATRSVLGGA